MPRSTRPHGRTTLAVTSLPGGEQRYLNDIRSRTTVSTLTPDQIHQIGLHEIDRIEADMLVIAHHEGFADLASYRESLKSNSEIPADFRRPDRSMTFASTSHRCSRSCRSCLATFLALPVTVEAIPDFQAAMATHYQTGTPDGKRPGRVVVATSNFAHRSLIDDEAMPTTRAFPGITCSCPWRSR